MSDKVSDEGKSRRLNVYLKPAVWQRLRLHCKEKARRTDASVTYAGEIAKLIERHIPLVVEKR